MWCCLRSLTAKSAASGADQEAATSWQRLRQQPTDSTRAFGRRSLLAIVAVLITISPVSGVCGQPTSKNLLTGEQQAVLSPFQKMLDGLARRDTSEMNSVLLPGGSVTMLRGGKPVQLSFSDFLSFLQDQMKATKSVIAEPIHHPVIQIDDDLAVIWTPYAFLVDGKVEHCGTDIATLARMRGRWLISSLEDNARSTCRGH